MKFVHCQVYKLTKVYRLLRLRAIENHRRYLGPETSLLDSARDLGTDWGGRPLVLGELESETALPLDLDATVQSIAQACRKFVPVAGVAQCVAEYVGAPLIWAVLCAPIQPSEWMGSPYAQSNRPRRSIHSVHLDEQRVTVIANEKNAVYKLYEFRVLCWDVYDNCQCTVFQWVTKSADKCGSLCYHDDERHMW